MTVNPTGVRFLTVPDDDNVPVLPREKRINNFQVSLHLIKAAIGGGVLAMPSAVHKAGLVPGTVGIIIISLLVIYCCNLLIESVQYLRSLRDAGILPPNDKAYEQEEEEDLDFARTTRKSIELGPSWLQGQARWMSITLQVCILSGQFGFLAVCNQFVAQNAKDIVEHFTGKASVSIALYALGVYVFLVGLVFVKTLHYMSFLSGLANVMGIGSLFITFAYCFQNFQPIESIPKFNGVTAIPNLFGTVLYAFEVITVLVPVENKMKDPSSLPGWNGVMSTSLVIATAMYTAIGFYGYLAFGDAVKDTITYNMPFTPWYYLISKPMYVVAILLSYALQFYVLFKILWEYIAPRLRQKSGRFIRSSEALLRVGLVSGAFLVSIAIPNVGALISITGASACAIMSIIAPAIVNYATSYHNPNNSANKIKWIAVRNSLIVVLGVIGGIIGLITSIQDVVNIYSK